MDVGAQGVARPGRRPGLTRDQVAEVALGCVDAEGIDALSMPRLARELGVGTMTLYGYVSDKNDLLDAVVDMAVRDVPDLTIAELDWRAAVEAVVEAVHEVLETHPAIVAIRLRQPVVRPEALRFGETVMGLLLAAGFEPERAASCFRLLFTYVFGSSALGSRRAEAADRRHAAEAIAALDPSTHPTLTAHVGPFSAAISGDDEFRFGLNLILDAIESLALPRDD